MHSHSDVEARLGFDLIRGRLKSLCIASLGQQLVDAMRFNSDPDIVSTSLRQNDEFVQLLSMEGSLPVSHYSDLSDCFSKASVAGSYLETEEFLELHHALDTIIACRKIMKKYREEYPVLFAEAESVQESFAIIKRIESTIDDQALVKDSASSDLSHIRKKLRSEQARLRRSIEQVYKQAVAQHWVPEGALPTIRGGRLVIPILSEHKRKLKGFIQDESATGQTVFMEPAEALESNNEIRDLEHAERREVIRILTALTDQLRQELPVILHAFKFLAWIDFTRARARLSIELEATMPQLVKQPNLRYVNARHPLLFLSLKGKREVVPLTIELTEVERFLLVSGPNAGGKSVCLKTVGLLQYMLQCGLLIPVSGDSTAGIFEKIFIDIGDQQSIENDLSTYSSHLRNMAHFLSHGDDRSLVLMDELGAGTDPNFGGAIAEAILASLLARGVWGVATTHYYNLKVFAEKTEGIRNGAMRFDNNNMMPLYILDIGKPGSSFALEIAQQTGLPEDTLQQARELAGKELVGLETLVRNLEQEKVELAAKMKTLQAKEIELKKLLEKYEALVHEVETGKKGILQKAKEEARQLLETTNKEIEKTIRHIRENQAQRTETKKARQRLQSLEQEVVKKEKSASVRKPEVLFPGDRVRLIGQESTGQVLTIKGKKVTVQWGDLKSTTALDKLEKVMGGTSSYTASKTHSSGMDLGSKRSSFSDLLDVRGKRVEEVIPLLDQFIDAAVLLGFGEVKVLHGKGEGVLRKVIRDQLKQFRQVASFTDEHVERGGEGITVIVLK